MGIFEYIKQELKLASLMGYGPEYSSEAKKMGGRKRNPLSAEEHSKMSEVDFRDYYVNRDSLFQWYFKYLSNIDKLDALSDAVRLIRKYKIKRVLSLGCGPGVLEYIMAEMLGGEVKLICADYDSFMVEGGNDLLGDRLEFKKFDFYNDDIKDMIRNHNIEMIIMFGSACSMDNENYERFLKEVGQTDNKFIISFEAGVSGMKWVAVKILRVVKYALLYIKGVPHRTIEAGHAYFRDITELKKIYKKANWHIEKLSRKRNYKYSYLLTRE